MHLAIELFRDELTALRRLADERGESLAETAAYVLRTLLVDTGHLDPAGASNDNREEMD